MLRLMLKGRDISLIRAQSAGLVPEACALARPLASERGIHLDFFDFFDLSAPGECHVLADQQRLVFQATLRVAEQVRCAPA